MKQDRLLFLDPVFKEMIWGGERLKKDFGYDIPGTRTGECWAISAHEHGDCKVSSGLYKDKTLSELWNTKRELFGDYPGVKFPLLVKIIDANDDLSIQVHPDDTYARFHENGSFGKTECWYILDCKDDGDIVIGHNAKDRQELSDMIREKRWNELIRTIPIKKGDFLQIEPGTVHAIKGGTMILETQQNSDITYRVYDYDRLSDGRPRELHVEKSIDVITAPHIDHSAFVQLETDSGNMETLISCPYYTVVKIHVEGRYEGSMAQPFMNVSVLEGEGTLDGTMIRKGMHFIMTNGDGSYNIEGTITLLCSYPGIQHNETRAGID